MTDEELKAALKNQTPIWHAELWQDHETNTRVILTECLVKTFTDLTFTVVTVGTEKRRSRVFYNGRRRNSAGVPQQYQPTRQKAVEALCQRLRGEIKHLQSRITQEERDYAIAFAAFKAEEPTTSVIPPAYTCGHKDGCICGQGCDA